MATVVASLVVLALAVPASARPADPDSATTAAVAASVPSCVQTDLDDSGYVDYLRVINGCNHSLRIKVVLAFHVDKPCRTIPAYDYYDYDWKYPGRFDGLVSC
jgi:hypothetical protein